MCIRGYSFVLAFFMYNNQGCLNFHSRALWQQSLPLGCLDQFHNRTRSTSKIGLRFCSLDKDSKLQPFVWSVPRAKPLRV